MNSLRKPASRLELSPPLDTDQTKELPASKSNYQRVYFLESGYPNIDTMFQNFYHSLETHGSNRPHLLVIEAPPGAGKTHLVSHKILPRVERWRRQIYNATGEDLHFRLFHWDKIENDTKRALLLTRSVLQHQPTISPDLHAALTLGLQSPRFSELNYYQLLNLFLDSIPQSGEPYSPEFLFLTALTLKIQLANFLQSSPPYTLAVVDKVGGLGFRAPFEKHWIIGREFANEMMEEIDDQHPPFSNLDQLVTGYIGLIPGPYLEVELDYRNLRNHVNTLKEANDLAAAFGRHRYRHSAQLYAAKEGGSRTQVELSRNLIRQLIIQYQDYLDLPLEVSLTINLPYTASVLLNTDLPIPPILDHHLAVMAHQCDQVAGWVDTPPFYLFWQMCWSFAESRILEKVALDSHSDYSCIALNNPQPKSPSRAKK